MRKKILGWVILVSVCLLFFGGLASLLAGSILGGLVALSQVLGLLVGAGIGVGGFAWACAYAIELIQGER